ncbi:response regulator, partial [bacterium]|nr:response regulator [bacterium]
IKEIAYQKKIKIKVTIQSDLGWIKGDMTKVKQIIFNLLSNAVKFTEPGKKIGIDARNLTDGVEVVVWDQGIGIPENHLEKIFDPFEQVKRSNQSKDIGTGTGLGLTISRRLIELHQGTLTVTSKMGEGSRFTIRLPGKIAVDEQLLEDTFVKNSTPSGDFLKGITILAVEDNESNKQLIEAVLEPSGCCLKFAASGEEAVQMVLEKEFDLILMDIQLPGIDGTEAMKQIRRNREKPIPIIALTAFAMNNDGKRYLAAGFDDYVSKPINIDLLEEKIRAVLL